MNGQETGGTASLTAIISMRVPEPQFEGQTKTKLGNGEVEGRISTYQNHPKNLQINVVGSHTFDFKSDDNYYASVYAPKARVKIDHKGDLFGAVLAKSLKVGNQVQIHYDESLRGAGGGVVVVTVK